MSKGAFKLRTDKAMSGKKTGLTGSGKMSSSHGCTGQSKDNNMTRTTGGYMIGKGTRTFHKNGIKQYSGVKGDTRHANQPKHKSLAKGGF